MFCSIADALLLSSVGMREPAGGQFVLAGSESRAPDDGNPWRKTDYRQTSAPRTFNYLLAADEATIVTSFFMLTSRLVEI